MKSIVWLDSSLEDIRRFPMEAREEAGYELFQVQNGGDPSDWKPMSQVGLGVKEIRIHGKNECRVIYVAKFEESVYVLHAFVKKTQKTSQKDLDLASKRFKNLIRLKRSAS